MPVHTLSRSILELRQLGDHLLEIADDEPVESGTTMAAATVYAADWLTGGKTVT